MEVQSGTNQSDKFMGLGEDFFFLFKKNWLSSSLAEHKC